MNEYSVNIEVKDGDGKIICSQPYNEFMYGKKILKYKKFYMAGNYMIYW